jgi:hypothetical protein
MRRLLDTAVGGCEVVICLAVRRFFCLAPECAKVTFAQQVSGLTSRHARRTPAMTAVLQAVALALGGRAGARLSGRLAAGVSRMTLTRLIRALPDPAVDKAPRVLGVDEFVLRKGHSYGTLLVDVETRRPVDILDERSSESFAAWLTARPGAELICRDRAGCYADGGARGAPDAVQVVDRWHLWHNLGAAVERAVTGHREHLLAALAQPAVSPSAGADTPAAPPPAAPRTGRFADRTRRRHADVHRLLAAGCSLSQVATDLGLSRTTVRRFARAAGPEELLENDGTGRRPSILDEHEPYLRERWNAGCTNAAVLWQEIRDRGCLERVAGTAYGGEDGATGSKPPGRRHPRRHPSQSPARHRGHRTRPANRGPVSRLPVGSLHPRRGHGRTARREQTRLPAAKARSYGAPLIAR